MKKETSVHVRGQPYPTHEIIAIGKKIGLTKEQIRELCRELKITNFSQTWWDDEQHHKGIGCSKSVIEPWNDK